VIAFGDSKGIATKSEEGGTDVKADVEEPGSRST
jgi:hypothetical protein